MKRTDEKSQVPDVIKDLVRNAGICVMSTIAGDRPYSSLMRYICDVTVTEIYLVTHRDTTKYKNLRENPHVSLLVDTREKGDLSTVQALSIDGRYVPFEDNYRNDDVRSEFIAKHPDLRNFADHPDAVVIRVVIQSFLLLNGLEDAHHIKVSS